MTTEVVLLGSGGWIPSPRRQTACALVRRGGQAVVIDAGTGLARLLAQPALLDGVKRLDLVLTHFHLDHICGLAYVPALPLPCSLTVWGPGRLLYERATETILDSVSVEPVHPVSLPQLGVAVRDIEPGEFELGDFTIRHRRQDKHSQPTLGLRFDDDFAWVTDTADDPGSTDLARGCRALFHEAWSHAGAPMDSGIHATGAGAGQTADRAGVERLTLIHLNPRPGMVAPVLGETRRHFGDAHPGNDGDKVSV